MKKFFAILAILLLALCCGCRRTNEAEPQMQNSKLRALPISEEECLLVWSRSNDKYVHSYRVYCNGKLIGNTEEIRNLAGQKREIFYDYGEELMLPLVNVHNFLLTDLQPKTEYTVEVKAVSKKDNRESEAAESISTRVMLPEPKKVVKVTDYGVVGDGQASDTAALQAAINACPKGGRVFVPRGVYRCGALWLHGDLELYLHEGAVLLASDKPEDFLVNAKGERQEQRFYSLLNTLPVQGHDRVRNISLRGHGIIDGNGWIKAYDGSYANDPLDGNVLKIGLLAKQEMEYHLQKGLSYHEAYGRCSSLIELTKVENMHIQGLTIRNPVRHALVLKDCYDVVTENVRFETYNADNGDGLIFAGGRGLITVNCFFDTGGDCLRFSSGRGLEALHNTPSGAAWIFNNYFAHGRGAVVLGRQTGAWIENILAEDNVLFGTETGLLCRTTDAVGGGGRKVTFRHNVMRDIIMQAYLLETLSDEKDAKKSFVKSSVPGQFKDIVVESDSVYGTGRAGIEVRGSQQQPYHNIVFRDIYFFQSHPQVVKNLEKGVFQDLIWE